MEMIIELIRTMYPYSTIDRGTLLIEAGVLDSIGIMALISLLERYYGIVIPDDAVTPENFMSVERIYQLFEQCQQAQPSNHE